jgi:hypothetical protein
VGRIVERVSAERIDERRLDGLVWIVVDEISYRRGSATSRRSPTTAGAIVWCGPGRDSATLTEFFVELGPRKESIRAFDSGCGARLFDRSRDGLPVRPGRLLERLDHAAAQQKVVGGRLERDDRLA